MKPHKIPTTMLECRMPVIEKGELYNFISIPAELPVILINLF